MVAGLFAYYSVWLAAQPRDKEHPYGHGKIEFISASIEGTLVGLAGLIIIGKSIYNLFYPHQVHDVGIGIYLTAGAGLVNLAMGLVLKRRGQQDNSITLEASGAHLLSDAWSSGGLIIGLALLWFTGWIWIDNVMAILFGGIILFSAIRILRRSIAGIMDEADFNLLKRMITVLNKERKPDWIDVHNLRVIQYGSKLHVDAHITLPWYYDLQQAHDTMAEVEQIIEDQFKNVELFIHMDPCIPRSCQICTLSDCKVRKQAFVERPDWTLRQVLSNEKHSV